MAKRKRRTHGGLLPATEVMTDRGWVKIYSLTLDDQVMVYDRVSGWTAKNQIRKNAIPSATWAWEIVTEHGNFCVGEGEVVPTTTGRRTAGARWPALSVYTALTDVARPRANGGVLTVLVALLRYGVIDSSGCSVRVRGTDQRNVIRAILGRDGAVCREGWEKWRCALATPRLRGVVIDLTGLCPSHAPLLQAAYKMFIEDTYLLRQQADELQRYFTRSGIGCELLSYGARARVAFHEKDSSKVLSRSRRRVPRLFRLSGAEGKIAIRQGGSPMIVNITRSDNGKAERTRTGKT